MSTQKKTPTMLIQQYDVAFCKRNAVQQLLANYDSACQIN